MCKLSLLLCRAHLSFLQIIKTLVFRLTACMPPIAMRSSLAQLSSCAAYNLHVVIVFYMVSDILQDELLEEQLCA